jgi:hypothetical protein
MVLMLKRRASRASIGSVAIADSTPVLLPGKLGAVIWMPIVELKGARAATRRGSKTLPELREGKKNNGPHGQLKSAGRFWAPQFFFFSCGRK